VAKITGENFLSDYVRRSFNRSQNKRTAAKTVAKEKLEHYFMGITRLAFGI
jgi:hypothetical protein